MQFLWRVHLAWLIHPLQPLFNERRGTLNSWYFMDSFFICLFPVLPHLKAVNYWSLFWMVMEKPITPVLQGMFHQGEFRGIPFQPQWQLCSAVASPGACRVPPEVLCIFYFPLPSTLLDSASWHWIQRQIHLFFFFFLALQNKPQLFLEMTHFLTLDSGKTQTF